MNNHHMTLCGILELTSQDNVAPITKFQDNWKFYQAGSYVQGGLVISPGLCIYTIRNIKIDLKYVATGNEQGLFPKDAYYCALVKIPTDDEEPHKLCELDAEGTYRYSNMLLTTSLNGESYEPGIRLDWIKLKAGETLCLIGASPSEQNICVLIEFDVFIKD